MVHFNIKAKFKSLDAQSGAVEDRGRPQMEAWRVKVEPWIVCRPVVVPDFHHFDPDLGPQ